MRNIRATVLLHSKIKLEIPVISELEMIIVLETHLPHITLHKFKNCNNFLKKLTFIQIYSPRTLFQITDTTPRRVKDLPFVFEKEFNLIKITPLTHETWWEENSVNYYTTSSPKIQKFLHLQTKPKYWGGGMKQNDLRIRVCMDTRIFFLFIRKTFNYK